MSRVRKKIPDKSHSPKDQRREYAEGVLSEQGVYEAESDRLEVKVAVFALYMSFVFECILIVMIMIGLPLSVLISQYHKLTTSGVVLVVAFTVAMSVLCLYTISFVRDSALDPLRKA